MNFKNIIDKHELIIKKLIKIKEKDDNLNNIYLKPYRPLCIKSCNLRKPRNSFLEEITGITLTGFL